MVHSLILDIKAFPAEDYSYIWASFLSRLRQRLFLKVNSGSETTDTISLSQNMPMTALTKVGSGPGGGQDSSRDPAPRWVDLQGVLYSHSRLPIPNLAIGLGCIGTGGVSNGFTGTLLTMLSSHTPGKGDINLIDQCPCSRYFVRKLGLFNFP